MSRFTLLVLLLASLMTGCASFNPQPKLQTLPANLRQLCPPLLPPEDGSRATILRTLIEWANLYADCQAKHAATVEAVTR